jgi:general secretion pathway protein G
MKAKSGFTLVEILIVVVILGILAAIVIPQFTEASTEAKVSRLASDLQTMRSQIELYKIQHSDALPGTVADVDFEAAMTGYTTATGAAADAPGDGVYGPYLQKVPTNPFVTENGNVVGAADANDCGWNYDSTTGTIHAADADHQAL